MLVNAVYFKGAWATAFDPRKTTPQPFTLSDAMDFIVPSGSLATFDSALTPASLAAIVAAVGPPESGVGLLLPKFSFGTTLALVPLLQGLGVTDLFDPSKANLSGMDGAMDLYVKTVAEEAIVEVDETGTVAAAASAATGDQPGGEASPVAIDQPLPLPHPRHEKRQHPVRGSGPGPAAGVLARPEVTPPG